MLKGKHIILGITGSIAAYKAAYLLRLLIKRGSRSTSGNDSLGERIHYAGYLVFAERQACG